MKPIDATQMKLIHIAQSQLGLPEDDYRMIIESQTKGKKQSSKELTYVEADRLINYFKTLGFKIKAKKSRTRPARVERQWRRAKRDYSNVYVLPSKDQLNMIETLKDKISWRVEGGFKLWLAKYMKIDRIKTDQEAEKVIEGLKGMLDHQLKGSATCQNG